MVFTTSVDLILILFWHRDMSEDMLSLNITIFTQTGTQLDHMRSVVRPHTSVAYALDEPTMKPHVTCMVPGRVSSTYNLNELRQGAQLTYDNFIYIAA